MGGSNVLPVGRFSPSAGIWVDRTANSVSITGSMELFGPEATAARAASIQSSINTTWTKSFPDGYSVRSNISVRYRGPGSSASNSATQIEADRISGPSHVTLGITNRSMTLNANESKAFTWTPAHEFGHIIGLTDRYSEGIMSSIAGQFGGARSATIEPGYAGNLMGQDGGTLASRNVADLAEENAPSPYWINDDDQVRDWINAHSAADIRRLSTNDKVTAINTLMGGWISDDDVSAIGRICSSVTDPVQAQAIRTRIDVLTFSSLGQRTTVRIAFSRMP